MPQTYVSYRFSFDGYIGAINSGIGLYASQDNQGDNTLRTTQFGLQYMYQARLGAELALNIGMQFSYALLNLNWNNLQFYDQIDLLYGFNDVFGNPNPSAEPVPGSFASSYFDMGAGLLLVGNRFYLGLSSYHLTNPELSFYGNGQSSLPLSVSGQAGLLLKTRENRDPLVFNPVATYTNQGGFQQFQVGAYLRKSILITGLFVKHNTAGLSDLSLCAGLTRDLFSLAYSYDITLGDLGGLTGGAHELSLQFNLPESKRHVTRKNQKNMLGCPRVL
jgi:type IX secretion system PorP/SprF family membrane protein